MKIEVKICAYEVKSCAYEVKIPAYEVKISAYEESLANKFWYGSLPRVVKSWAHWADEDMIQKNQANFHL